MFGIILPTQVSPGNSTPWGTAFLSDRGLDSDVPLCDTSTDFDITAVRESQNSVIIKIYVVCRESPHSVINIIGREIFHSTTTLLFGEC